MEKLTYAEFQRFCFVSEALLGRVSDDRIRHCGSKSLAALAMDMRCALLTNDDDKIVEAGDALMAVIPPQLLSRRKVPQRLPHR